jgi:hypothetical protein
VRETSFQSAQRAEPFVIDNTSGYIVNLTGPDGSSNIEKAGFYYELAEARQMGKASKATLASYGFLEAGRWSLSKAVKSGITFTLELYREERVVYAFEVADEVKYIGICREQDFKTRMRAYQNQGAQKKGGSTNKHVATRIRECLEAGQDVNILALKPNQSIKFHDLDIDLIAGLEKPLINLCDPDWNRELKRTREKLMRRTLQNLTNDQLQSLKKLLEESP